jgi:hypothetical protein
MERSRPGRLDRFALGAGALVNRRVLAVGLAAILLAGCYDPFSPAEAATPTSSSSSAGASVAAQVPVLFGNALDSANTDMIPVLVSDSVEVVDGTSTQTYSKLKACAKTLVGYSHLPVWSMGSVTRVSTTSDTVVERFDYSINRWIGDDTVRIAHATAAQWTVVRDVYWTLVRWEEDAGDSGWIGLCASPR